jgi:hypothetical protein
MTSPQVQVPIPAAAKTLIVGCKLPNGLILEMGRYGDTRYQKVEVKGANSAKVAGGYGLTPVDAEFWAAWLKKHAHLDCVTKGHVFAHSTEASAISHATERAELKTGLERLDPVKNLPENVEVDREHKKAADRETAEIYGSRSFQ